MKKILGILFSVLLTAVMLSACSSSSSSVVAAGGTGKILMTGGTGSAVGGDGGWSYIETYQPGGVMISKSGKADTRFSIPAWISQVGVDAGSNPVMISADTTIAVLASSVTDTVAGDLYLIAGDTNLYKSSAWGGALDDARNIVTGLTVKSGKILILGLNRDTTGSGNYDAAQVHFDSDVNIEGKLTTSDLVSSISGTVNMRHSDYATSRDMGALDLRTDAQLFIGRAGSIITHGRDGAATGERGGDGGYIYLSANNLLMNEGTIDCSGGNGFDLSNTSTTIGGNACVSGDGSGGTNNELGADGTGSWGAWLEINVSGGIGPDPLGSGGGLFINTGKITMNGGDGSDGGSTAEFLGYIFSDVFNTGAITASGGAGTSGNGGFMFDIFSLNSRYGSIYNSGTITKIGGSGPTGGGGGGTVRLDAGYEYVPYAGSTAFSGGTVGDIVNSGKITVDGGNVTSDGYGGPGGYISMMCFGAIKTDADLSANGGDSMGANIGASGGLLYLQNTPPYDPRTSTYLPVREITVSGTLSLTGGNGETGGNGGTLQIYQAQSNAQAASDSKVELLGYASADLSGGNGRTGGGSARTGGPNTLTMNIVTFADLAAVGYAKPEGPIVNEIPMKITGGDTTGTAGDGGVGGKISWYGGGTNYGPGDISILKNTGKLDVSGGAGGSSTGNGGNSGTIYWYAHDGVTNTAELYLKGGDCVSGTGGDGAYDGLWILSGLDIMNSGKIDTTGGKGDTGGNGSQWQNSTPFGNYVYLSAAGMLTNTGSIISMGGAGKTTNGNGGGIDLVSGSGSTKNSGSLNITAGSDAGGAAGTDGEVWIDWTQVQ